MTPEGVPPCSPKDLTGSFYPGGRPAPGEFASAGDTNQILIRTTGAGPCMVRRPVTFEYLSASGPVIPRHPDYQYSSFDPTVLSPTPLTPAQDADVRWSTALWAEVVSATSPERPTGPCVTRDQALITSLRITFDVGSVTVPIPNGMTTCQAQLSSGISSR